MAKVIKIWLPKGRFIFDSDLHGHFQKIETSKGYVLNTGDILPTVENKKLYCSMEDFQREGFRYFTGKSFSKMKEIVFESITLAKKRYYNQPISYVNGNHEIKMIEKYDKYNLKEEIYKNLDTMNKIKNKNLDYAPYSILEKILILKAERASDFSHILKDLTSVHKYVKPENYIFMLHRPGDLFASIKMYSNYLNNNDKTIPMLGIVGHNHKYEDITRNHRSAKYSESYLKIFLYLDYDKKCNQYTIKNGKIEKVEEDSLIKTIFPQTIALFPYRKTKREIYLAPIFHPGIYGDYAEYDTGKIHFYEIQENEQDNTYFYKRNSYDLIYLISLILEMEKEDRKYKNGIKFDSYSFIV